MDPVAYGGPHTLNLRIASSAVHEDRSFESLLTSDSVARQGQPWSDRGLKTICGPCGGVIFRRVAAV